MPSYAAVLREHVSHIRRMSEVVGWPDNDRMERQASELEGLAALLERITPNAFPTAFRSVRGVRIVDVDAAIIDVLQQLAAGPQPEEGRDA